MWLSNVPIQVKRKTTGRKQEDLNWLLHRNSAPTDHSGEISNSLSACQEKGGGEKGS